MPLISVIVPVYNAEDTIGDCLEALLAQSLEVEIIAVDDGSTDATPALLEKYRARGIKVICGEHAGAGPARNRGVQAAAGEIILFTDSDCVPERDWAAQLSAGLTRAKGDRVVGAKGIYTCDQREIVARFVQLEFEQRYRRLARQPYLEFVDTYSAAYRREVLVTHGGFDPRYPGAIVEDAELAWRLASQGYRMVFVPTARVRHRHPATIGAYFRRKFRIGYWRVAVYGQHPDRLARDSHTSRLAKLQMLLLGVVVCLGMAGLFARLAGQRGFARRFTYGTAGAGGLMLASTLPLAIESFRRDLPAALWSIPLQWLRALALTSGAALGLIRSVTSRRSATPVHSEIPHTRGVAKRGYVP